MFTSKTELIKRKCGDVRLSDTRFWNTFAQINNTPHLISMGLA